MKEEHIWTKKPETMLDWFCVVGACIALYLTLNNLGYFLGKIGVFIGIVSPFAGGIVIAYVLDPMVKFFYTKLFKEKKKTRGFAILLAYLVAILRNHLIFWKKHSTKCLSLYRYQSTGQGSDTLLWGGIT